MNKKLQKTTFAISLALALLIPVTTNSTATPETILAASCSDQASMHILTTKYRVPEHRAYSIVTAVDNATTEGTYPPKTLVYALMRHESEFNPRANHMGNIGILQINANANKMRPADLFDIEKSVEHAVRILRENYQRTRSAYGAIVAYNVGLGRYLSSPFRSAYANRVTATATGFDQTLQSACY